ncbi:hypothetical protein D0867_01848 [Hortaea werneckii]|uniref:Uncharacterized protein n=1 Tax=Hortaea werneckii TaxID=91943 RepID=A0A3M7A8J6_HORWE|nr:hypothetical protein D0867_01848 [Hortaea werneckii]
MVSIAQTSLAEILLRFNTGIVQIISYFLEKDNGDIVHLDYRSLTDLSDLSRLETCRVLQQLCVRLSQRGSRPLSDSRRTARDEISRREDSSKISGHSIARVVIQGSSKPAQLIFVKPREREKKPRPSRTHSAPTYELPEIPQAVDTPPCSPPPYELHERPAKPSRAREQQRPPTTPKLRKSRTSQTHLPSPLSTPRPRPDRVRALRDPVPTYYSQLSDQTKLGEIPLERWPEAFDFAGMEVANREALEKGWPLNRWEEEERRRERTEGGKRRRGFWGLFRRKGGAG